jgi:hypothetical protein
MTVHGVVSSGKAASVGSLSVVDAAGSSVAVAGSAVSVAGCGVSVVGAGVSVVGGGSVAGVITVGVRLSTVGVAGMGVADGKAVAVGKGVLVGLGVRVATFGTYKR